MTCRPAVGTHVSCSDVISYKANITSALMSAAHASYHDFNSLARHACVDIVSYKANITSALMSAAHAICHDVNSFIARHSCIVLLI